MKTITYEQLHSEVPALIDKNGLIDKTMTFIKTNYAGYMATCRSKEPTHRLIAIKHTDYYLVQLKSKPEK
jgi:hypothetical protein